ncbi:MAG: cytochrome c [Burkholderiales bacterium]|nr:cytochrome c [Burkholderiales bacterium]ODU67583.1 MAG: alcohol dehydrogenase [Lautropia sp. SCN 66-9]
MRRWLFAILTLAVIIGAGVALVVALNLRDEAPLDGSASGSELAARFTNPALIERGRYLAQAGNCMTCHTVRGGAPYAGGRPIDTPFGVVHSSNLTSDADTGLGRWSAGQFWRALHNGRSRDGRLLYPAFPYPNYTQVTREDSDAIYAYLRSLPPVAQPNRPHALRFPYDTQAALAVWRALFFRPGVFQPQAGQSEQWNRGAYLVGGLGHCNACHAGRNLLGATGAALELGGGMIAAQSWYAPSLASPAEAGVGDWPADEIVQLLKTGQSPRGIVVGPMAEVVVRSTQHLSDADLQAMAAFLKSLPPSEPRRRPAAPPASGELMKRGAVLYERHCADCHGADGQGQPHAYPPLAGNRAVTLEPPANALRIVLHGGYAPATAANPRPFGMPPFAAQLADDEIAAVVSYIRAAWGNRGSEVRSVEVVRYR